MADTNGATPTPETKTFTQKDIEIERANAQHYKQLAEEAAAKLKGFEGVDPTDYKKTKAELDEIRKKAALGDPAKLEEWQKNTEAEIAKRVEKRVQEAEARAEKLAKDNKELTVTDRVFAVFAPHVTEDMGDFIKEQIRKYGDLDVNGNIIFKDDAGKVRYAPGSATEFMKVEQFVEHVRAKYPSSFKPTQVGGGKTAGQKLPAYQGRQLTRDQIRALPSMEQRKYFQENPAAAQGYLSGKL